MTAYVISESKVLDEALYDRYRSLASPAVSKYGGRYIVRRSLPEAVEGTWLDQERLVIVEFSSIDRAHEWYSSREYAVALEVRQQALIRRLLFVDGVSSSSQSEI
jgi:uncharacterized protein (DUF1330 family)